MYNLFRFELIKFISRIKWIFVVSILILLITVQYFMHSSFNNLDIQLTNLENQKNQLIGIMSEVANEVNGKEKVDHIQKESNLLSEKIGALKDGDWERELEIDIELLEHLLIGLETGLISSISTPYSEIQKELALKEEIKSLNLEPRIFGNVGFDSSGFTLLFAKIVLPLILFMLLILLISDISGYENDRGTMFLMKSTPNSNTSILIAKTLVSVLMGIGLLILSFLLPYLFAAPFKGFGSLKYPLIFGDDYTTTGQVLLKYFIFSCFIVIFICVLTQLVHSFIQKGSMTIYFLLILFIAQSLIVKTLSNGDSEILTYLPFIYLNPIHIIDDSSLSIQTGISVLTLWSVFVFMLTFFIVKSNRRGIPKL